MARGRNRYPELAKEAVEKYREFQRLEPTDIGSFSSSFRIPARVRLLGDAAWVTYRSGKVDPASLKRPRKPVDYIHEHDAGVRVYVTDGTADTDVPNFIRSVEPDGALALLGLNLGFAWKDPLDGELHEAEGTRPLPELYTIPTGKALLVVQSKRKVLAMMWGGALGVFARGIDG